MPRLRMMHGHREMKTKDGGTHPEAFLEFFDEQSTRIFHAITDEDGSTFSVDIYPDGPSWHVGAHLDCDQVHALGLFCARQFMGGEPQEHLMAIRDAAKFAYDRLEAWNDRAKADEEHPPYTEITARLRDIAYALMQLAKGLAVEVAPFESDRWDEERKEKS